MPHVFVTREFSKQNFCKCLWNLFSIVECQNINARHLCLRNDSADLDTTVIHRDSGHSPLASSEQPF